MVDSDIALAKVATIQRCLKRISDATQLNPSHMDELDTQDLISEINS